MSTVLVGDRPPEVEAWLERRRARGQDLFDEVWEGEYHVSPAPSGRHGDLDDQIAFLLRPRAVAEGLRPSGPLNIGTQGDYRVPDRAYLRGGGHRVYNPTAAVIVEIVSPNDETYRKFDFYFRRGVDEVLIADPERRTIQWFTRSGDRFLPVAGSELLDVTGDQLHGEIDWPG